MFLLLPLLAPLLLPIGAVLAPIIVVLSIAIAVVQAAVNLAVQAALAGIRLLTNGSMGSSGAFELWATNHFDWKRAQKGQEEFDSEMSALNARLGDEDGNGIPDGYDEEFQGGSDPLAVKYPRLPLVQNDYVRYLPRSLTLTPQPVPVGRKGLVRSEEMVGGFASASGGGQFVVVKWNEGHIFTNANAMDLWRLGHVSNAFR